jgi:outer membrane beta-barrel protein
MTRLSFGVFALAATLGSGVARAQPAAAEPPPAAGADAPADTKLDDAAAAAATAEQATGPRRPAYEDIVVVPRKAFIKSGRLEVAPLAGITLNDNLIHHYSLGGELNWFLTDVFSIGIQGQYFIKERSQRDELVGLQYNRVPTLNKYKYAGVFNFGYVPGYGKFTLFNKYIWHWDVFASAGVGAIWTEIIPRVNGDEAFQSINIMPDFGVGTRFFLSDWLTVSFSLRDYVFNDKFEPTSRSTTDDIATVKANAQSQFVNNIMFFTSVGFYLPTSFKYNTAR